MIKHVFLAFAAGLAIVGGSGGALAAARATPIQTQSLEAIDAIGHAAVASGMTPGLVIGVMQGGRILFVRGYGEGNLETQDKVTPETVFRVGSLTKQFTAACIEILAEQGRLSLDDKLSKYFPGFYRGDEVTLREILNHTSGISNYVTQNFIDVHSRDDIRSDEMVDIIRQQYPPFSFSPGTAWRYSNSGFFLAGAIVEKVSGQPLGDFMRTHIFEPLNLIATAIDSSDVVVPHRASGYNLRGGKAGAFRNAEYVSMTTPGGAGALRSTAGDLLTWTNALLSGKLIPMKLVQEMLTPATLTDGRKSSASLPPGVPKEEYGLGLTLSEDGEPRRIFHHGAINGFNATLVTAPDQHISWVVLENINVSTSGLSGSAAIAKQVEHVLLP